MDIQLKRGNKDNFSDVTLLAGEPAFIIDTGELYIGDGTTKKLINKPVPDISNLPTKQELNSAITALDNDISNRGYLTEIGNIDGGVF